MGIEKEKQKLEIRATNKHAILSMFQNHLENARATSRFGAVCSFFYCNLLNRDGQLLFVTSTLNVSDLRIAYQDGVQYGTVSISLDTVDPITQGGGHIADRNYVISRSNLDLEKLHITSNLTVEEPFKRLGIGSALLALDDEIYQLLYNEFHTIPGAKTVQALIIDQTEDEDLYWTTNQFDQKPDWEPSIDGHVFRKEITKRSR